MNSLQTTISQAIYLLPELILVCSALLLLLIDFLQSKKRLQIGKIIFILAVFFAGWIAFDRGTQSIVVWKVLLLDSSSLAFLLIFLLGALIFLIASWSSVSLTTLFTILIMVTGASIVAKSINWIVLLLGVELLSLGAYSLTAMQHTSKGWESGLKYIIFGGVSTAIFLFGITLFFGLTGTFQLTSSLVPDGMLGQQPSILMGILIFIFAGLFFKITAFPFHLWAPDVYESIPAPLAAFFSVVPKIAVLGFLLKFCMVINVFGRVDIPWQDFLAIIAMVTMTLGNLVALNQQNVKRMMAYSSIAHTGFFMIALVAFNEFAFESLIFYGLVYLFMNFAAFVFMHYYEEKAGLVTMDHYKGLARVHPFQTFLIVIVMIALVGLPPTAGFSAKLFLFTGLWESYEASSSTMVWVLLIVGIGNALISLFYYLKIPFYMIFRTNSEEVMITDGVAGRLNFLLVILVLPLLLLFIYPGIIMDLINMINFTL